MESSSTVANFLFFILFLIFALFAHQVYYSASYPKNNYEDPNCNNSCLPLTQCQQTGSINNGITFMAAKPAYNCVGYLYFPLKSIGLIKSE